MIQLRLFPGLPLPGILAILLLVSLLSCHVSGPQRGNTLRSAATAHHITMGTAASSMYLQDRKYTRILSSEFAQLEPENEMKFARVHPQRDRYDFHAADVLVAFAESHGMVVRGHTLVWHRQVPQWVTARAYSPGELSAILQDHITTVMQHYAGRVYAWDVLNEAFNDDGTMRSTVWYDQPGIGFAGLGTQYIEQAFRWAHAADPKAKLFYNDYGAEGVNAKSDAIYAMAQDFRRRGAPLDGIGFQAHVEVAYDTPEALASFAANLQRFAALGLELHITELDIRLRDSSADSLARQAKFYGKIAGICVRQPACKVLQTWGFTDKYSWIPRFYPGMDWALLWDARYRKKPGYFRVLTTLQGQEKSF